MNLPFPQGASKDKSIQNLTNSLVNIVISEKKWREPACWNRIRQRNEAKKRIEALGEVFENLKLKNGP